MLKAFIKLCVFAGVGLFVLVKILAWSESDKDNSVGFYLPYELFYYSKDNKAEADAYKFELQLSPTEALKKAGLTNCVVQVSQSTYQAFAQQQAHQSNKGQKYTLVAVYWDKLTRSPHCYTGFDNLKPIEQFTAQQYAKVNQGQFQQLFETKP